MGVSEIEPEFRVMAKNFLGEVRRTQVLDYGPGAIIDFRAGAKGGGPVSVVATGLEHWDETAGAAFHRNGQVISEPRLERKLSVRSFRLPPVDDRDRDNDPKKTWLVGARFPTWLQCPRCGELKQQRNWDKEIGDPSRWCARCSHSMDTRIHVVPVRFVVACEHGHLEEFPWRWWLARASHKKTCDGPNRIKLKNRGSIGLSGLFLVCGCGASISMEGIFGKELLKSRGCSGKRPWLGTEGEECGATPRVLQRGASNLYFPITVSALSIPPWSDKLQELIGINWAHLVNASRDERATILKVFGSKTLEALGMSLEEVLDEIEKRAGYVKDPRTENLKLDEYTNLCEGMPGTDHEGVHDQEFEVRQQSVPRELAPYIAKLAKVVRLREVRALKSFSRIYEPATADDPGRATFGALSTCSTSWLPAVEVRGEGIFIALNLARVHKWESGESFRGIARTIDQHFQRNYSSREMGEESSRTVITARQLLLHTFSHALMRHVSLECGYDTASIRERIYVDEADPEMAGILIYTSSSDSEGTLGGLARQAEPKLFTKVLVEALRAATWCSSDPLCINGITSMSESYNGAACHCCVLVPETSCEMFNRFLDRTTLVGNPQTGITGYFDQLLTRE